MKETNHLIMDRPFPKSISQTEKCKRLLEVVSPDDVLAVFIKADPDAMASAMALKRFFWRRVKKVHIYHTNIIKRADNLAMIKLLKVDLKHIRELDSTGITKWAILDSQPHHDERLSKYRYDIIIDHHPVLPTSVGSFVDIREAYGANSTIMTEYLRTAKVRPSPRLATALFYGIKTDTDNFARASLPNDIEAFRYLYPFTNLNMIKKIEFSEMTKKTLASFKTAIDNLRFYKDRVFIHMGKVSDPDVLVIIADFFLKMAEVTWCIVSGVYGHRLVVIFRNAGFRLDSGKMAKKLFGQLGSAGGHMSAGRAEVPLQAIDVDIQDLSQIRQFVWDKLKEM
ncbi:MAG: DHH family phosphoesterase [Desulfatiglandales bacterium]